MADSIIGTGLFIVVCALALLGLAFIPFGTWDMSVVSQCEKYGYWQSGQTRVTCVVERPESKPRVML